MAWGYGAGAEYLIYSRRRQSQGGICWVSGRDQMPRLAGRERQPGKNLETLHRYRRTDSEGIH